MNVIDCYLLEESGDVGSDKNNPMSLEQRYLSLDNYYSIIESTHSMQNADQTRHWLLMAMVLGNDPNQR